MTPTKHLPLTEDELRIWRDYIETSELLRSRLGSKMQRDSGLSMGDYAVLLALWEAGERRLRSSALADSVGWERSRLSHHLGRMEARGLIRREECAEDTRGMEIVLTADGLRAFRRSSVPHLRDVHDLFVSALSPEQLKSLESVTAVLRAHLEQNEIR